MKKFLVCITAVVALTMLVDSAMAQGRRGFGGGTDPLSLTRNENIRKELEIEEDQVAEIRKIQEEMNQELQIVQNEVRTKYAKKLGDVLLPHQTKRLQEISIQLQGTGALSTADVAKKLGMSEAQKKKIADVRAESRTKMRELFRGGRFDREAFAKLREDSEKSVLGVLSASQRAAFDKLKGKPIDREQLLGGRGRRGGGNQRKRPKGPDTQ